MFTFKVFCCSDVGRYHHPPSGVPGTKGLRVNTRRLKLWVSLQNILCDGFYFRRYELNPKYKSESFKLRNTDSLTNEKYKLNLEIPKPNQVIFETRSLRSYHPKIWNVLPCYIKTLENVNSLTANIKCWNCNQYTFVLAESAKIRLQDNRISNKINYTWFFIKFNA